MSETSNNQSVFYSASGKRWRKFRFVWILLAVVTTVFAAVFVTSVLMNPFLPQVRLKLNAALPQAKDIVPAMPEKPVSQHEAAIKNIGKEAIVERAKREKANRASLLNAPPIERLQNKGRPLAIGFYVNWDDSSYTSLKRNINELDWIVPEWIRLSGDETNPLVLDVDENAQQFIRENKPEMPVVPLLQNYKDKEWNSDVLAKAIATEDSGQKLINSLLETVDKNKFGGLTIDLEEVPASVQANLFEFMQSLHAEFKKRGLILAQAVPFDNPDRKLRL